MVDQIDEFESIFKRAEREQFVFAHVPIRSVALITDLDDASATQQKDRLTEFVPGLKDVSDWRFVTGSEFANVAQLLEQVNEEQTDLIVTWRHIKEEDFVPQHSLGVFLDVLTQTTAIPVLVLPGTSGNPKPFRDTDCDRVMVVADHISGDNRLINYGVRFCRNGGTMWLCHIEDDRVFSRYMQAIGRIPRIDTDDAERLIGDQLLKDATDFVESCIEVLREKGPKVGFESVVQFGHYLKEYRSLIEDNKIDLFVANTKDDDQLAMHGIAYSLSVELTNVPMLLL